MRSMPFKADLKGMLPKNLADTNVNVKLSFQGHYSEPDLTLKLKAE